MRIQDIVIDSLRNVFIFEGHTPTVYLGHIEEYQHLLTGEYLYRARLAVAEYHEKIENAAHELAKRLYPDCNSWSIGRVNYRVSTQGVEPPPPLDN